MRHDDPPPMLTLACAGPAPLAERPDDELMELARAGVQPAFAALIRRHQAALRSYCARVCGDAAADDVAQETFVALWATRASYEPRGRFRSYLFALAERRALNALRTSRRLTRKHSASHSEPCPDPDQLDALLARERQARLYAQVERLPGEQRRALLLRYAGGLEYGEIAALVARPEATVRTRVFLGLKRLRAFLHARGEP
jgi:RNA polymerase sigma-70 factor (ECF subfamily)